MSQVLPRTETESAELGTSNLNIRKIVVAIDLTPRSKKAATYAAEFAKRLNAALTVVHVFAPEPVTEFTSEQAHLAFEEGRRRTLAKLAKLIENLRRTGVECHDDFRVGDPAEEVMMAAHGIDADLILACIFVNYFRAAGIRSRRGQSTRSVLSLFVHQGQDVTEFC